MSAKHSLGQWLAVGPRVYMAEKPGSLIATVGYLRDGRVEAANARLIAAAPDLLAALQDYVAGDCPEAGDIRANRIFAAAKAAIARATGEQQ